MKQKWMKWIAAFAVALTVFTTVNIDGFTPTPNAGDTTYLPDISVNLQQVDEAQKDWFGEGE